jgi:hypothetical protein
MNKKINKIKILLRENLIPSTPPPSPIKNSCQIEFSEYFSQDSQMYINKLLRETNEKNKEIIEDEIKNKNVVRVELNSLDINNKILIEIIILLYLFIVTLFVGFIKHIFN